MKPQEYHVPDHVEIETHIHRAQQLRAQEVRRQMKALRAWIGNPVSQLSGMLGGASKKTA